MGKKYIIKKVAFLGIVLLIFGFYFAIGGVLGYGQNGNFASIVMMIIGIISASFGYAFVYLFFHINKIGHTKKDKHHIKTHNINFGGIQ